MQEQTFLNIWLHRLRRSYIVITFICACIEFVLCIPSVIITFVVLSKVNVPIFLYVLYYCLQLPLLIFIGLRILFRYLNHGITVEAANSESMFTPGIMAGMAIFFVFLPAVSTITLTLSYTLLLFEDFKNYLPRTKPQVPEITLCEICGEPGIYDVCNHCRGKYAKEAARVTTQLRRARQAHEPATLTLPEWVNICNLYHWQCYMPNCENSFSDLEHIIPIGQGDAHTGGTTSANCRPICRSHNTKKGSRHPGALYPGDF
ncbi:HNH endonuclease signature motif containing protein [Ktedonobacter sp. SOSP1-52]|uniref:HNH endonuclease signature motif containing protein n=1 Tax=Ktedonobacter sp. SOSP1-52 TaxID=2778366 RepID=UPI001915935D|nr:HNH endonuclease signature motif containing protein [Ktedonobacter sp. SOSP1-52]